MDECIINYVAVNVVSLFVPGRCLETSPYVIILNSGSFYYKRYKTNRIFSGFSEVTHTNGVPDSHEFPITRHLYAFRKNSS